MNPATPLGNEFELKLHAVESTHIQSLLTGSVNVKYLGVKVNVLSQPHVVYPVGTLPFTGQQYLNPLTVISANPLAVTHEHFLDKVPIELTIVLTIVWRYPLLQRQLSVLNPAVPVTFPSGRQVAV